MLELVTWDGKWRPDGTIRESGGHSVGKGGESDVERRYLQGGSLHLCQLRTNGLVPMSKY
jgi:hypothetical protein